MELIIFLVVVFVFIFAYFIYGSINQRKNHKEYLKILKKEYGQYPSKKYNTDHFQNISKYYIKHRQANTIDDITWNDLEMDDIFMLMNHTNSSVGEEYLYSRLRTPKTSKGQFEKEEEQIQYFMNHEEDRIKLQMAFTKMGTTGKYSIYDYFDFLVTLGNRNNKKHIFMNVLYILPILFLFVLPAYGMMALIGIMCFNLLSYSKEKSEIEPYIISLKYVQRILKNTQKLESLKMDVLKEELNEIKETRSKFQKFSRKTMWLTIGENNGDPLSIFGLYFVMLFHLDLMAFNSMLKQVRNLTKEIDQLLTQLGHIEFVIAIGAFRKSMDSYCKPQFHKNGLLKSENMYHPMIENPVKNSFSIEKGMLLTGSNASGKSTFLKTVAINAILAQTINTCMADSFSTKYYRIYSSMALKDSLESSESYYIVEIKSLKRILDATNCEDSSPILCFVDEVLRGTNTVERIAASTQILKSLALKGVTCIAATHDIELTHLLTTQYDNYHFEEEVLEDDIVFNYELLKGRATTRNAIKLLKVIGYQDDIIEKAEQLASYFTTTGNWE